MAQVMVRYKVKPERAEENAELVRAVYEELHRTAPTGLTYATFVLEDGVSFVHMATHDDGDNPLAQVAAFQRFQGQIRDRCVEPPVVSRMREVGSYRP